MIETTSKEDYTYFNNKGLGEYINTYTGKRFHILNPKPDQICVEDIAHSLSQIVRFTGHLENFYSVGHHSLMCYELATYLNYSNLERIYVLFHDAVECIVNDLNSVIKQYLPSYKAIEQNCMNVIWEMLNVPPPTEEQYEMVKIIDNTLLILEMKILGNRSEEDIPILEVVEEFLDFEHFTFDDLSMKDVESLFLLIHSKLMPKVQEELLDIQGGCIDGSKD